MCVCVLLIVIDIIGILYLYLYIGTTKERGRNTERIDGCNDPNRIYLYIYNYYILYDIKTL